MDPWLGQYWNNLVQFHLSYLPLEHNVVPTLSPKLGTYKVITLGQCGSMVGTVLEQPSPISFILFTIGAQCRPNIVAQAWDILSNYLGTMWIHGWDSTGTTLSNFIYLIYHWNTMSSQHCCPCLGRWGKFSKNKLVPKRSPMLYQPGTQAWDKVVPGV